MSPAHHPLWFSLEQHARSRNPRSGSGPGRRAALAAAIPHPEPLAARRGGLAHGRAAAVVSRQALELAALGAGAGPPSGPPARAVLVAAGALPCRRAAVATGLAGHARAAVGVVEPLELGAGQDTRGRAGRNPR